MPSGMHATESNHFGVHEFIRLCRLVGAEPYLAANVGSGSAEGVSRLGVVLQRASRNRKAWPTSAPGTAIADPFRVKYWGVGNESWGCGGDMTPGEYATAYRKFVTQFPVYVTPFLIATGTARPLARHGSRLDHGLLRGDAGRPPQPGPRLLAALLHRLPQRPDAGRRLHAARLVRRAARRAADRGDDRGALVGDEPVRSRASHEAGDRRVGRVVQARAKRSRPATS